MEIRLIPLRAIAHDPLQPRKQHSEESLQGLADSIRQHGLLQPITISQIPDTETYLIISGERRWRAAQKLKLESLPCIVKQIPQEERLTEQLIENLQREDLLPVEKAKGMDLIKGTMNLTNREIGKRLGLSERTVGYLLDLLALPEEISEAVVSSPNRPSGGQITEKHARFLKQLNPEPELQTAVVDRIRDDKLNSEDTGKLVKALKRKPDQSDEIMRSPMEHLNRFFGDDDVAVPFDMNDDSAPSTLAPSAQQILDFLPRLTATKPSEMTVPAARQLLDALTSLKMTVESMLQDCKTRIGE